MLEQNVFDNTTLSFDDNKVLKMSIGYANSWLSVQDHNQKFKSSIGSGRTNESNGNYKKEACVARKRLKRRGLEDHQKPSTRS